MAAVDHRERKRRTAQVARDIIAAEGIDAATIRRIAAELGCSTHAITHFFADKDELLLWTYIALEREGFEHFDAVLEGDPLDVIGCLLSMTPLDPEFAALWRVYVSFWERSERHATFAAALQGSLRKTEDLIATSLCRRYPSLGDPARSARQLIALVNGISVQILHNPDAWTREQARRAYERFLNAIVDADELVLPAE